MKLLLSGDMTPANGIVGAGSDSLNWPLPVRPGDTLHVVSEILEVRPSRSRPTQGMIKVRSTTLNQNDAPVQHFIANLVVVTRPMASTDHDADTGQ